MPTILRNTKPEKRLNFEVSVLMAHFRTQSNPTKNFCVHLSKREHFFSFFNNFFHFFGEKSQNLQKNCKMDDKNPRVETRSIL